VFTGVSGSGKSSLVFSTIAAESQRLRDKGNTILVVEHKPEMIELADHVVDLGPRAGTKGGEIQFEGTVEALRASDTLTGRHLDDRAELKGLGRPACTSRTCSNCSGCSTGSSRPASR
jgi:excinuclease UvrABC ATPase subunit